MYITKKPITEILQAAYALSKPQGMGQLHYTPGPLTTEEVEKYTTARNPSWYTFDYVKGRAVKLSCMKKGDYFVLRITDDNWYDHTPEQAKELINRLEAEKWTDEQQQAA